jgi:hypothetical protein
MPCNINKGNWTHTKKQKQTNKHKTKQKQKKKQKKTKKKQTNKQTYLKKVTDKQEYVTDLTLRVPCWNSILQFLQKQEIVIVNNLNDRKYRLNL